MLQRTLRDIKVRKARSKLFSKITRSISAPFVILESTRNTLFLIPIPHACNNHDSAVSHTLKCNINPHHLKVCTRMVIVPLPHIPKNCVVRCCFLIHYKPSKIPYFPDISLCNISKIQRKEKDTHSNPKIRKIIFTCQAHRGLLLWRSRGRSDAVGAAASSLDCLTVDTRNPQALQTLRVGSECWRGCGSCGLILTSERRSWQLDRVFDMAKLAGCRAAVPMSW